MTPQPKGYPYLSNFVINNWLQFLWYFGLGSTSKLK